MCHIKRSKYAARNDFFISSPEKYYNEVFGKCEVDEWFEDQVGSNFTTSNDKAAIFLDADKWIRDNDKNI